MFYKNTKIINMKKNIILVITLGGAMFVSCTRNIESKSGISIFNRSVFSSVNTLATAD